MDAKKEKSYFCSRIRDLFTLCEKQSCPQFSSFLNEEEQKMAETAFAPFSRKGNVFLFYGGYESAQRRMLGVFPDWMEPDLSLFPICSFTVEFPERFSLRHQDFLGAFMGQGIRRETIGDILVQKGKGAVFCEERVKKVFLTQIDKIGSVGVTLKEGVAEELLVLEPPAERLVNVASFRLDAVAAALGNISREVAQRQIVSGLVFVNYAEKKDVSALLKEGDVLTIRGTGKFIFDAVIGETRKGRKNLRFFYYGGKRKR